MNRKEKMELLRSLNVEFKGNISNIKLEELLKEHNIVIEQLSANGVIDMVESPVKDYSQTDSTIRELTPENLQKALSSDTPKECGKNGCPLPEVKGKTTEKRFIENGVEYIKTFNANGDSISCIEA